MARAFGLTQLLGLLILGAGAFAARAYFPVVETRSWDQVTTFRFDDEVCRERREERQMVAYVHPDDDVPLTVAELADDYNLELARVCAANAWPRDCGRRRLQPGDGLWLPLSLSGPVSPPTQDTVEAGGTP